MRKRRNIFSIAVLALFVAVTGAQTLAQKSDSAEILLQRAIQKEMVDGDLKGAIELYKKVMGTPGVSTRTAADVLVHIGRAYERTGDVEARKAYERVIREYSGQAEAVAAAQRRLAGLKLKLLPEGLTARLICRDCGDSQGSVASNGTLMATTDWDNGGIILRDLTTGRVTKIATDSLTRDSIAFPLSPVLSRDARSIAYRVSMRGAQEKLYVIGLEAGAKPILLVDDPAFRGASPVGWSLDSKSVLVNTRNADSTSQLVWVSVPDRKIKTLPWTVEGVISHPTISPDGRYVAYAAAKNAEPRSSTQALSGRHIYVVASDGSGKEEEVVKEGGNESPNWTPDGKHILFLSDRSNNIGLWSVAVQNGRAIARPARVRPNTGRIDPLGHTSADSYYYMLNQSPYDEIVIGDVRSGTLQASLSSGESTPGGQTPGWSLDGKFIAFSRRRFGEANAYDAVVRTVETGEEKIYRHNGFASAYEMIWFHDHKSFLAWAREPNMPENQRVIYRVNTATDEWQSLMTIDISTLAPSTGISVDGQTLYKGGREQRISAVNRPFDRIFSFDLKTGQRKQIATLPEPAFHFMLSPDGQTFMLAIQPNSQRRDEFYLATMSVDGSGYRRVTGPIKSPVVAWTGDSRHVFFADADAPGPQNPKAKSRLMRIARDSDKAEFTGMTLTGLNGFSLNRDGSRIAFSSTKAGFSEVWAFDNISSQINP